MAMKIINKIIWLFDYWILDLIYGYTDQEQEAYWFFMLKKYGDKYKEKYIESVYFDDRYDN